MSADPAVYYDYKTILEEIAAASAEESVGNGYRAGMEFLQMYRSEYEYELEETIQAFSLEVYTSAYEKVRDENTE